MTNLTWSNLELILPHNRNKKRGNIFKTLTSGRMETGGWLLTPPNEIKISKKLFQNWTKVIFCKIKTRWLHLTYFDNVLSFDTIRIYKPPWKLKFHCGNQHCYIACSYTLALLVTNPSNLCSQGLSVSPLWLARQTCSQMLDSGERC
jgi:hypothetical protein